MGPLKPRAFFLVLAVAQRQNVEGSIIVREATSLTPPDTIVRQNTAHYQVISDEVTYAEATGKCASLATTVPESGFTPRLFREDSQEKGEDVDGILDKGSVGFIFIVLVAFLLLHIFFCRKSTDLQAKL